jgi:hypothetical protein
MSPMQAVSDLQCLFVCVAAGRELLRTTAFQPLLQFPFISLHFFFLAADI